MLLSVCFGHDLVDSDVFEVFFRVVKNGAGLAIYHCDVPEFILWQAKGDKSNLGVKREVLDFFVLLKFGPKFIKIIVDFPGFFLIGFDGSTVHAVEFEDLEGGEGLLGESVFEDFLNFFSEGEDFGGDGGEFIEVNFFLIEQGPELHHGVESEVDEVFWIIKKGIPNSMSL